MAINLSNLTFTDQDDIVPPSGVEPIFVSSFATINTLAGDDIINGGNNIKIPDDTYSFSNSGTLNTNSGNDLITGIFNRNDSYNFFPQAAISNSGPADPNEGDYATINTGDGNDTITGIFNDLSDSYSVGSGIQNVRATIDTGNGNDIITGIGYDYGILTEITIINTGNGDDIISAISEGTGIDSRVNTTINTGDGNDIITATGGGGWGILLLSGAIDTGEGNDIINGTGGGGYGLVFSTADFSYVESRIDTGEGDDIITGTGDESGITNHGTINTGNGNDIIRGTGDQGIGSSGTINTGNGDDFIISKGKLFNSSEVFLEDGNDLILANTNLANRAIENLGSLETGNGNDIIISSGIIYNEGTINTGNGNDSIIANGGFESGLNISGNVFLGDGEDNIKGFGSGDFYGGNGKDILQLTPGSYTIGISETMVNFTKDSTIMKTFEFEQLIAGGTTYDFTSLTSNQIIVVA